MLKRGMPESSIPCVPEDVGQQMHVYLRIHFFQVHEETLWSQAFRGTIKPDLYFKGTAKEVACLNTTQSGIENTEKKIGASDRMRLCKRIQV